MRILLIADEPEAMLWEHLDKRRLEGIDLVISCGDLPSEYLSFLTCFTPAPILYIHGNHDGKYEKKPPEGCTCIEDKVVRVCGLRIMGLGGCMRYNRGPHQYTQKQMTKRVKKMWFQLWRSRGVDLIITHAPAYQLGDDKDLAHTGFMAFVELIDKYQPVALVHGHVHQSYRHDFKRVRQRGETMVVNACGSYVLELDDEMVKNRMLPRQNARSEEGVKG